MVSYTLNKGVSVGATWNASAKLRIDADAIRERRNYKPRSSLNVPAGLDDTLRSASVKASWAIRDRIAWNSAATLGDTLGSLRAQTCRDFEHIFVDGGSVDATLDMIGACPGDKRVLHGVQGGISRAMSCGTR
ncbi:MAG: hypothetical protein JWQ80_3371 [Massilia sp.]|nr:hypothetical protein [Massilia sp.]